MASSSVDPNDLFGVKGLVVVITGGGSGLGLMMAQALESNGAIVYIIGRRKELIEKAASTAKHGNIRAIQGDVCNKADLERAVEEIKKAVGYVNVVVANSGRSGPNAREMLSENNISKFRDLLLGLDPAEFTDTFAVNVTGVFNTIVAFLELLDAGNKCGLKQRSQVITTASIGAYVRYPISGYAYGPSKAAVVQMMKQFSTSLGTFNIRTNIIAPGWFPSDMTTDVVERAKDKTFVPEQRFGDSEDMSGAIMFLVSRAGAYLNGNVLVNDGGRLGIMPSTY
ncbi:NAD(P)-binding protein [Annulohypoxylon moriforme]|nr:NAD(P)-binding protein [Annulohypoxylon moriforme]